MDRKAYDADDFDPLGPCDSEIFRLLRYPNGSTQLTNQHYSDITRYPSSTATGFRQTENLHTTFPRLTADVPLQRPHIM